MFSYDQNHLHHHQQYWICPPFYDRIKNGTYLCWYVSPLDITYSKMAQNHHHQTNNNSFLENIWVVLGPTPSLQSPYETQNEEPPSEQTE